MILRDFQSLYSYLELGKHVRAAMVVNGTFLIHKTAVVMGMNNCKKKPARVGKGGHIGICSPSILNFPADNVLQFGMSTICHNLAANSTLSGGLASVILSLLKLAG